MRPTRAAWFFAAGLSWLVLRGILAGAVPALDPVRIADRGGWLLVIPVISVLASLTAPLFFLSFLTHHRFVYQGALRLATVLALATSVATFTLALYSSVTTVRDPAPAATGPGSAVGWFSTVSPLLFFASIFLFLLAFWFQERTDPRLHLAAAIGALGTLIPTVMIVMWFIHSWFEGALAWFPGFGQSPAVKLLGLIAAGALLWFLETFAVSYVDGPGGTEVA